MDTDTLIVMMIVYTVAFGMLSAIIATSKNRDGGSWFIIGALLGVIGLIMAAAMPKEEAKDYRSERMKKTDKFAARLAKEKEDAEYAKWKETK